MEVRNCTTCGRIFNSVMDLKRCPDCRKKDETKFRMIKEYLYDVPGASIEEVSENLGIDRQTILHFLREGRLETVGDNMILYCEGCGKPISTGRLCEDCHRDEAMNIKSIGKRSSTNKSKQMYTKKK